eukprot:7251666-Prymnesium_polylepis.1
MTTLAPRPLAHLCPGGWRRPCGEESRSAGECGSGSAIRSWAVVCVWSLVLSELCRALLHLSIG